MPPEGAAIDAVAQELGVSVATLERWRGQALADPEDARATPQQTRADKRRIKELERVLRRRDMALAGTAALLGLSKELEAIFHQGEDE